ncbi:MAG: CDP-alcohol phosphatidyltransferase family protein, partial [Pseudomonadota bacterium]
MSDKKPGLSSHFIISLNRVDCLTLSGVIFAFGALILISAKQFSFALACLFSAMLVDALDGIWARKRKVTRAFGRYLDGFVDQLDYLLVPSVFLYFWGFDHFFYIIILLLFIMSGIVRLSVFNEIGNITQCGKSSYLGMPVFWSLFIAATAYL